MSTTIPIALALPLSPLLIDAPQPSCFWHRMRHIPRRVTHVLIACIIVILSGGCASNYEPRPDLSSVETIGVVLSEKSSEPLEAEDVIELYNHDIPKGEGPGKTIAVGAGTGAAVGLAVGAAASCVWLGPACGGVWLMIYGPIFAGAGAAVGGTAGAAAGATAYHTQEQVEVAPVHRYEVNRVLPSLQRDYLTKPHLTERVLRLTRQQTPSIKFAPAVRDDERYRLNNLVQAEAPYTDANLVLSELRVLLAGKAEDDPRVRLTVRTQWQLTKYDASSNSDSTWGILSGSYKSEKYPLSVWLADEGALLRTHVNKGLEESLTGAFSELGGNKEKEDWQVLSADDSFW